MKTETGRAIDKKQLDINRKALGVCFFLLGFVFASWTSRIPSIKQAFGYNDAELGSVLLTMPLSSLAGLPFSGWLVSRFPTWLPLTVSFAVNALTLLLIPFAPNTFWLCVSLFLFAFSMRVMNIAVNTQSIHLQEHYERSIVASFHGLWSLGGISAIGVSTLAVSRDISMLHHFLVVTGLTLILTFALSGRLLRGDRGSGRTKMRMPLNAMILCLGGLSFFTAFCEGGVVDWVGVYFREELQLRLFTAGYLSYMISMTAFRFFSDRLKERIGERSVYLLSALLILGGMGLVISTRSDTAALLGFAITGMGTASVVPTTYALAARTTKHPAGVIISVLATFSIAGLLLGPAVIGYLSYAFGLRLAFLSFLVAGVMIIPLSFLAFRLQQRPKEGL